MARKAKINRVIIGLIQGDIFQQIADAIVVITGANLSVSDDLIALAGESVRLQVQRIGGCEVGSAVITDAGNFTGAAKIIHAVAPRWGEGSERGKLANTTWECLQLAEAHRLTSIVFPPISVGVLGFPLESCANIMLNRIIDFTFENLKYLHTVTICLEEESPALEIFEAEFKRQIQLLNETGEAQVRVG